MKVFKVLAFIGYSCFIFLLGVGVVIVGLAETSKKNEDNLLKIETKEKNLEIESKEESSAIKEDDYVNIVYINKKTKEVFIADSSDGSLKGLPMSIDGRPLEEDFEIITIKEKDKSFEKILYQRVIPTSLLIEDNFEKYLTNEQEISKAIDTYKMTLTTNSFDEEEIKKELLGSEFSIFTRYYTNKNNYLFELFRGTFDGYAKSYTNSIDREAEIFNTANTFRIPEGKLVTEKQEYSGIVKVERKDKIYVNGAVKQESQEYKYTVVHENGVTTVTSLELVN